MLQTGKDGPSGIRSVSDGGLTKEDTISQTAGAHHRPEEPRKVARAPDFLPKLRVRSRCFSERCLLMRPGHGTTGRRPAHTVAPPHPAKAVLPQALRPPSTVTPSHAFWEPTPTAGSSRA